VSGVASVGWWAVFITMLGIMSAFLSLVFGYFFYWTSRPSFLHHVTGPGLLWPSVALGLGLLAWGATMAAREFNGRDRAGMFIGGASLAALMSAASAAALIAGPLVTGLDPAAHVYPAMVWVLVIWTATQLVVGTIMQLYCLARRVTGRLTSVHDIDIVNVTLYWHFTAATVLITVGVIAGFPEVA
jgi:cytochrome c oxidase subunit I+III